MKIDIGHYRGPEDVASWVAEELCREIDIDEGDTVCAAAIGRLVACLAERGYLTAPEVHRIAADCDNVRAEFLP